MCCGVPASVIFFLSFAVLVQLNTNRSGQTSQYADLFDVSFSLLNYRFYLMPLYLLKFSLGGRIRFRVRWMRTSIHLHCLNSTCRICGGRSWKKQQKQAKNTPMQFRNYEEDLKNVLGVVVSEDSDWIECFSTVCVKFYVRLQNLKRQYPVSTEILAWPSLAVFFCSQQCLISKVVVMSVNLWLWFRYNFEIPTTCCLWKGMWLNWNFSLSATDTQQNQTGWWTLKLC